MSPLIFDLKLRQRDKLADFLVNFSLLWFGASLVAPFFSPPDNYFSLDFSLHFMVGLLLGGMLLFFSIKIIEKRGKREYRKL